MADFEDDYLIPAALRTVAEYADAARGAMSVRDVLSPLVLDLDGDGIEVSKLGFGAGASTTYFDMDNDGFAERTAWASGGDGMLVIDKNNDGKINNQAELFGNSATYANGFANLKSYDSNKDGKITSADTNFAKLKIWVDADSDGITDAGELKTLAQLKITQINVNATTLTNTFINENPVTHSSTFVMNGATRTVQDVWFRVDSMDTRVATASGTEGARTAPPAITLKGFGELRDLHVAMATDKALNKLVQDFVKNWTLGRFVLGSLDTDVTAILFKWAGVDTVAPNSRGPYVDARIAGFIEKLTGQPFTNAQLSSSASSKFVKLAYDEAFAVLKADLILQAGGSSMFATKPVYNYLTGEIEGGIVSAASLAALTAQAKVAPSGSGVFWKQAAAFLLQIKNADAYTAAEVQALNKAMKDSGLTVDWDYLTSIILPISTMTPGTGYAEVFEGSKFSDHLVGSNRPNTLIGGDGDDILIGRLGNDTLQGGNGNDTYIFRQGDDVDTIIETGGTNDVLSILGTFRAADIKFSRIIDNLNPNALGIYLKGTLITMVKDHFLGTTNTQLEKIILQDGTAIALSAFKNITGTTGNDTLNGLDNAKIAASDAIYGNAGNDTINGKKGNDYLAGGQGNDNYLYASGDGYDIVYDEGGTDKITFSGIALSSVTLVRTGLVDLMVQSGGKDLMLIKSQFISTSAIESLVFSQGSINLLTYQYRMDGTAGNDTLTGTYLNDIIYGQAGNDVLRGNDGADKIYGGAGDDQMDGGLGNDTIYYESGRDYMVDGGGTDTIVIVDKTVTAKDIMLVRAPGFSAEVDVYIKNVLAFTIRGQFGANPFETLSLAGGGSINLTKATYITPKTAGTAGNDVIYGTGSTDTINGGAGDDVINGGIDGNDIIDGGLGRDVLIGGLGHNTYKVNANSGVDTIIDKAGLDTILFGAGLDPSKMTLVRSGDDLNISFNGALAATVKGHFVDTGMMETLKFANNTTVNLTTYAFAQNGKAGADTLKGYAGADALYGLAGNDILYGYDGADTLDGGAGNDILYGGKGADKMTGGAGADTFVFEKESVIDTITDFKLSEGDRLSFAGMLEGFDPLQKAITDFVQITTVGANSIVKVDFNGGANSFVQVGTLMGVTGLTDEAALFASGTLMASPFG